MCLPLALVFFAAVLFHGVLDTWVQRVKGAKLPFNSSSYKNTIEVTDSNEVYVSGNAFSVSKTVSFRAGSRMQQLVSFVIEKQYE